MASKLPSEAYTVLQIKPKVGIVRFEPPSPVTDPTSGSDAKVMAAMVGYQPEGMDLAPIQEIGPLFTFDNKAAANAHADALTRELSKQAGIRVGAYRRSWAPDDATRCLYQGRRLETIVAVSRGSTEQNIAAYALWETPEAHLHTLCRCP